MPTASTNRRSTRSRPGQRARTFPVALRILPRDLPPPSDGRLPIRPACRRHRRRVRPGAGERRLRSVVPPTRCLNRRAAWHDRGAPTRSDDLDRAAGARRGRGGLSDRAFPQQALHTGAGARFSAAPRLRGCPRAREDRRGMRHSRGAVQDAHRGQSAGPDGQQVCDLRGSARLLPLVRQPGGAHRPAHLRRRHRPSGSGFPIWCAPRCNSRSTGRTWPRTSPGAASTCRRRTWRRSAAQNGDLAAGRAPRRCATGPRARRRRVCAS